MLPRREINKRLTCIFIRVPGMPPSEEKSPEALE
jgi:hypothetical protein